MEKSLAIYVSKYLSGITFIRHIVYLFSILCCFRIRSCSVTLSSSCLGSEDHTWGLCFCERVWTLPLRPVSRPWQFILPNRLRYSSLFCTVFFSKMDELYNRDHNRRTDAFFFFSFLRRSHRRVEKTKRMHETLTVRMAETEVKTSHTANTGSKWWTFSWHRQTRFMGSSVMLNAMKGWNYFHSISFSGGSSKAWMSWCLFRHHVFMLYLQTKLHIPFNKMSWSHSCQSYTQTFVL